ncbi:tetratricopeptide repeat protein [Roseomonas elaeocarpi]|uniref:Tetratricopeptide repeat protein n=1 Tax=Roseomonas elaeocarpi TaxID=907779 RepID=A0ABV6JYP6_9PROT
MRRPFRTLLLGAFAAAVLAAAAGGGVYLQRRGAAPVPAATEESLPIPPEPPLVEDSPEYVRCLALVRSDPQEALSTAEAWIANGGTDGARHCQALSLLATGEPERAAPRLEELGTHAGISNTARAAIYGQAGQAWMAAGDVNRAYGAVTLALSLTPNDPDLLVDRAAAAGALGRFNEALDDATHATTLDADRPDAWVYRAAALRHLNRTQEALRDVERALNIEPDNAEALLERGILRQLNSDMEGARQDWERAITAAPDSAAAELAQQNLELSEAGPAAR